MDLLDIRSGSADESIVQERKKRESEEAEIEDQIATEAKPVAKSEKKIFKPYLKPLHPYHYHPAYRHHYKPHESNEKPDDNMAKEKPTTMYYRYHPYNYRYPAMTEEEHEEGKESEKPVVYYHPYHGYHYRVKPHMKEDQNEAKEEEKVEKAMPYHHPYYHRYHYEVKPQMEDSDEDESDKPMAYHHPYYRPYFYYGHHRPYFYYHFKHAKPEKESEEEPMKHGSYFPFYFAKPTTQDEMKEIALEDNEPVEELIKEGEVPDYPCKHLAPGQDFPFFPFHYPPITNFPVKPMEESEEGEDGKSKTVSFPVHYHSYFPKYKYTSHKKPVEEMVEKEEATERRRRSALDLNVPLVQYVPESNPVLYQTEPLYNAVPATYLPTKVQVIKTTVNVPEEHSMAEETSMPSPQAAAVQLQPQQQVVFYPPLLPVQPQGVFSHPIPTVPLQTVRIPLQTVIVPASSSLIPDAASSPSAPLPESQFPIFSKDDNKDQQAALAF